ncbi:MAG: neutral/alkaline non-lysosomal ceramidase N-terminal domain-containing protein [Acidobacteria bacterium]|nr:neutral/alkaline non-lysosomal ceramidase N-terminal domain-containing protein [Acidobacteriota bacterium]
MLRVLAVGLCLWLSAPVLAQSVKGVPLKAGVAKVDITPPPGVPMWGYARRKGTATGTLDPLLARVLVLEAGSKRLALVTLDLGRPFGPASLEQLRSAAGKSSGISYVFVTASHTHSGPVVLDEYASGRPAWEAAALDKIAKAIEEAAGRLAEARLGTGKGTTYIGHNRLRQNPDGTVTWFERNPTLVPTSPFDPTVSVLRIDGADGQPMAILVNYATHPVVFGPDNLQYSADFPGAMVRTVEKAFGAQPICFFLQGAPGDINALYAVTPLEQDAVKMCEWSGRHLGEEAVRVAKAIPTESAEATLDYSEDILRFHLRWDPEKFRQGLIAIFGQKASEEFAPSIKQELQLPVSTVLINKRIAILGMPGEPFVDFQIDWRARCPVPDAFLVGYANGYHGYFPTIRACSLAGYGAAGVTTWVEPGAGERMVIHGLVKMYEMLGKLTNVPVGTDF